ncbi:DUF4397 domain-containing protein [Ketobacter sp.]|uniref:DUF4397 domain-containing protein n=1 Tax=Ketobacter sp. TaxID=2083498 RepID=UPI000F2B88F6|nr:DUF4397 domain-containing protein [Ketobacter sp.]RLT94739.1 MAG: DUF4397 domain-containing protein [Ketobacter sp.]
MQRTQLATLALATSSALLLTACDDEKYDKFFPKGELRVVHASPDAPPVNVLLNGKPSITDLDYAESSGFTTLRTGRYSIQVEGIIPGGNATVIDVAGFQISKNASPTVIAVNTVANIEPIVVEESSATPSDNEVALVVTHAAPVAGAVDVYLTAPGDSISGYSPAFNFDFKDSVDAGALAVGVVEIQVAIGATVVYNSGAIDLSAFAGQKLIMAAINSENDTENAAAPIKLLAVTDDNAVELRDADTQAGAKVVHASPDAAAAAGGAVEVFASSPVLGVDPVELIDAFDYTDVVPAATGYVAVPAATFTFDVAPDTDSIGDSVYTSAEVTFNAGLEYTAIAAGRVLSSPAFGLLATVDDNRAIATQGSLKVTHAAPAAGAVDVFVTAAGAYTSAEVEAGLAGDPLLDDFAFGTITDYVAVAPGAYDIRVVAGGVVAINIEALNVSGGDVLHAIARGPSEPAGAPADFGVILLSN